MATFSKDVILVTNPDIIPAIASQIEMEFLADGYEVRVYQLSSGGADISLSRGGIFKAVLGMKTALKVTLIPQVGSIHFIANVGIFGQQFLPTIISMFFLWPVLITQIWGLIQQSKMDDRVLGIAYRVMATQGANNAATLSGAKFCPNCGNKLDASTQFCPHCGHQL